MKKQLFKGTGVALITPFRNRAINYDALERIIEHVIEGGVDYIVSLGTTGEAITLSAAECRQVLDFTIKTVAGRVPIVAGYFGSNFTERLTDHIRQYNFDGVAAIMSSSPAYSKPSQEGIFQHYMAIAEVSPVPIIIYNVPSRTSSNVLPETVLRLAHANEKFVAVKEASGDVVQAMKILKNRPEHLLVLSGDDTLALPIIASGGDGVISVIANAFPAPFSDMVRAALCDDFETARRLNLNLLDIHPWLYTEGNPPGIKAAMEILGLCTSEVRIPLTPVSDTTRHHLQREIERVQGLVHT
ncbi:MAG TPA: 4-hydroxy-tetrahydrodipicolinate synthase [Saprospiraceae bacterium]|nr:4-hydroxy-tetrahydrodipicolinate synthase [Saprospiraceae bacterium]HMP13243.1 4-hydroxy-tetrahydrodipicolinate synthase [Saprospiraceae bacterium]